MQKSEVREQMSAVIPSNRFAPHNVKAEAEMLSRHKALNILPTERLTSKYNGKELNASVDKLAKCSVGSQSRDRNWYAGTFQPLLKQQRIAQAGQGVCIVAVLLLWGAVGALAALSFDSGADIPVCPSRTGIADRNVCATFESTNK